MDGLEVVILPALIALLGTIITVLVQYHQSKKQTHRNVSDSDHQMVLIADKKMAYRMLWEHVEDVHIKARKTTLKQHDFDLLLQAVNEYILKNRIFIDDFEWKLTNAYLEHVHHVQKLVAEFADENTKRQRYVTASNPSSEFVDLSLAIMEAFKKEDGLRDMLKRRVQEVINHDGVSANNKH